jgi:hypothetical protein
MIWRKIARIRRGRGREEGGVPQFDWIEIAGRCTDMNE